METALAIEKKFYTVMLASEQDAVGKKSDAILGLNLSNKAYETREEAVEAAKKMLGQRVDAVNRTAYNYIQVTGAAFYIMEAVALVEPEPLPSKVTEF